MIYRNLSGTNSSRFSVGKTSINSGEKVKFTNESDSLVEIEGKSPSGNDSLTPKKYVDDMSYVSGAISNITKENLTPNSVLVTDESGKVSVSQISSNKLNQLNTEFVSNEEIDKMMGIGGV